ncbi:MAG: hypothetical protein V5A54_06350 [Haloarculaceae archaeon]
MADLNDRGQIILIAGFALAVIFVALALVVNSAIFTENLATRGETTGGSDALIERHQVEESVETIVESANNDSTDPTGDIERSVENLSLQGSIQDAQSGRITSVVIDPESKVARLYQENDSRQYVNATGQEDWTLATGPDEFRTVEFNVSTDNLAEVNESETDKMFNFSVTDPNKWQMYVYKNYTSSGNGDYKVRVENGGDNKCSLSNSSTYLDIQINTSGLYVDSDGTSPSSCTVGGVPKPGYNITKFQNGDRANGTYSLVLENPDTINQTNFNETASPRADVWIEELEVMYRHETTRVQYVTNFTVESGGS